MNAEPQVIFDLKTGAVTPVPSKPNTQLCQPHHAEDLYAEVKALMPPTTSLVPRHYFETHALENALEVQIYLGKCRKAACIGAAAAINSNSYLLAKWREQHSRKQRPVKPFVSQAKRKAGGAGV